MYGILALIVIASLVGYGAYQFLTPRPEEVTVRIAIANPLDVVSFAPYYFVVQDKLLEKHGIKKYEMSIIAGGSGETLQVVETGSADIGIVKGENILLAVAKGSNIRIVAQLTGGTSSSQCIYVRANSPINNLNDLKEAVRKEVVKTIACTKPGSLSYINALLLRKALGFTEEQLKIVPLGDFKTMIAAVIKGEADVTLWTLPGVAKYIDAGSIKVIGNVKDVYPEILNWPGVVLVVRSDFAEKHPDIVKRVVDAFIEAYNIWLNNKQRVISLLTDPNYHNYPSWVANWWYDFEKVHPDGHISLSGIKDFLRVLKEAGVIKEIPDISKTYIGGYVPITP